MMSLDTQKLVELLPILNISVGSVLQLGFSVYILYYTLGYSVFAGVGVLILAIPLNLFLAGKAKKHQAEQMKYKDERVKLTSEVLVGIKVLKVMPLTFYIRLCKTH
jgi:ATP-binding cassette subfamily C (CFTR/MRP) protein 1